MDKQISVFTSKSVTLTNRLITPVYFASALQPSNIVEATAQWDTGATNTCISEDIAKKLGLIPTGKITIHTPSGFNTQNTYLANIILPNKVMINQIPVCDSKIGVQKIDILIGMDIIILGDFAISNFNEKTYFSFRLPSKTHIDFYREESVDKILGPKHGKGKKNKK